MRRFQLVCEDSQARAIEALALEYGLTEQEVLEQLVAVGLEELERIDGPSRRRVGE